MKFTIDLSQSDAAALKETARRLDISPEELLRLAVNDWIGQRSRKDFERAAKYVLEKNRELYDRLA